MSWIRCSPRQWAVWPLTALVAAGAGQVQTGWSCRGAEFLLGCSASDRMSPRPTHRPAPAVRIRVAKERDLAALLELEHRVFATDRLSRRSLRHFLRSPSAALIVAAGKDHRLAGTAI